MTSGTKINRQARKSWKIVKFFPASIILRCTFLAEYSTWIMSKIRTSFLAMSANMALCFSVSVKKKHLKVIKVKIKWIWNYLNTFSRYYCVHLRFSPKPRDHTRKPIKLLDLKSAGGHWPRHTFDSFRDWSTAGATSAIVIQSNSH